MLLYKHVFKSDFQAVSLRKENFFLCVFDSAPSCQKPQFYLLTINTVEVDFFVCGIWFFGFAFSEAWRVVNKKNTYLVVMQSFKDERCIAQDFSGPCGEIGSLCYWLAFLRTRYVRSDPVDEFSLKRIVGCPFFTCQKNPSSVNVKIRMAMFGLNCNLSGVKWMFSLKTLQSGWTWAAWVILLPTTISLLINWLQYSWNVLYWLALVLHCLQRLVILVWQNHPKKMSIRTENNINQKSFSSSFLLAA